MFALALVARAQPHEHRIGYHPAHAEPNRFVRVTPWVPQGRGRRPGRVAAGCPDHRGATASARSAGAETGLGDRGPWLACHQPDHAGLREVRAFEAGRLRQRPPRQGREAGRAVRRRRRRTSTTTRTATASRTTPRSTSSTWCCRTACTRNTRFARSRPASTCSARSRWRTRRRLRADDRRPARPPAAS